MKVRYTSGNGQLVFDLEAETAKALFSQLGSIQELFEAETKCGMCGGIDIRYSARIVEEYDFYELACRDCKAQFRFGQKKKGGDLFPKRKDDDNNWLPNGGWSIWEASGQTQARTQRPAEQRQPERSTENQRAPEPRRAEAPKGNPVPDGGGMPEGLQPSVDRLAEIFGWRITPTRIGPVLDQINEEFERNMGDPGSKKFAEMYRAFSSNPARDAKAYKKLFAELVDYWNGFKRAVA